MRETGDYAVQTFTVGRDRETGLVFISHPRWSVVGTGPTLADAAQDIMRDAPGIYAAYHGRTDLSGSAERMVEWLEEFFGFRTGSDPFDADQP